MPLGPDWKQEALAALGAGMSPEGIARSVALGSVLGVFPILGCPTLLCSAAALKLRVNLPAIQIVNYLVYPLQIALLMPFIRLGEYLFHGHSQAHGISISALLHANLGTAFLNLGATALHTVAAWFCICVPAGVLLYALLASVLRQRPMLQWIGQIEAQR
jgi:uncharacterized protein (DUF2062 family)